MKVFALSFSLNIIYSGYYLVFNLIYLLIDTVISLQHNMTLLCHQFNKIINPRVIA